MTGNEVPLVVVVLREVLKGVGVGGEGWAKRGERGGAGRVGGEGTVIPVAVFVSCSCLSSLLLASVLSVVPLCEFVSSNFNVLFFCLVLCVCVLICTSFFGLSDSVSLYGAVALYAQSSVREREKFRRFFFNRMSFVLAVPRA